jgi:hypothetical protein
MAASVTSREPIPIPLRRARVYSGRWAELLRAARTPEGRRRNLAPLLALALGSSFLVGVILGWRRHRS